MEEVNVVRFDIMSYGSQKLNPFDVGTLSELLKPLDYTLGKECSVYNSTSLPFVWYESLSSEDLEDKPLYEAISKAHERDWPCVDNEGQWRPLNYTRRHFNKTIQDILDTGTYPNPWLNRNTGMDIFGKTYVGSPVNLIIFFHPSEICYNPYEFEALEAEAKKKDIKLISIHSLMKGFKFKAGKEVKDLSERLVQGLINSSIYFSKCSLSRKTITEAMFRYEYDQYKQLVNEYEQLKEVS